MTTLHHKLRQPLECLSSGDTGELGIQLIQSEGLNCPTLTLHLLQHLHSPLPVLHPPLPILIDDLIGLMHMSLMDTILPLESLSLPLEELLNTLTLVLGMQMLYAFRTAQPRQLPTIYLHTYCLHQAFSITDMLVVLQDVLLLLSLILQQQQLLCSWRNEITVLLQFIRHLVIWVIHSRYCLIRETACPIVLLEGLHLLHLSEGNLSSWHLLEVGLECNTRAIGDWSFSLLLQQLLLSYLEVVVLHLNYIIQPSVHSVS